MLVPSKAEVVKEALRRVPTNNLGLPEGIYRSDLLPSEIVRGKQATEEAFGPTIGAAGLSLGGETLVLDEKLLKQAYMPLDYEEGFPTLPDGSPFWEKMEFEPADAYLAFQEYLIQGKSGPRQIFQLERNERLQHEITELHRKELPPSHGGKVIALRGHHEPDPSRPASRGTNGASPASDPVEPSGQMLTPRVSTLTLREWFYVYYWGPRSLAHDLFFVQSTRKSRAMMALQLESDHSLAATRLYNRLMAIINTGKYKDEDGRVVELLTDEGIPKFWADLTPRVAVDLLKQVVQLQRLSLGLSPATPSVLANIIGTRVKGTKGEITVGTNEEEHGVDGRGDETLSDDERLRRIASLLNAARARRAGSAA